MYFLWLFGDNVEDKLGRIWYLFFYICSGIAASLLYALFDRHTTIPAIGASGAISGVMGAYMFLYPFATVKVLFITRVVDVPAWLFLGIWFFFQLSFALIHRSAGYSNVAWFAHVGGFAFGVIVARLKKVADERLPQILA
jgi:membrane associated rhomboid family serine protease